MMTRPSFATMMMDTFDDDDDKADLDESNIDDFGSSVMVEFA